MSVVSYEHRVAQMQIPGDEDRQILLAKRYVRRLKQKARLAVSLNDRLLLKEDVKEAEKVLRKLRLNIFDLGDMLVIRVAMKREAAMDHLL